MSVFGWVVVAAAIFGVPLLTIFLLGRLPGVPGAWQKPARHTLLAVTFLFCALLTVAGDQHLNWTDLLATFVTGAGFIIFALMAGREASRALRRPSEAPGERSST